MHPPREQFAPRALQQLDWFQPRMQLVFSPQFWLLTGPYKKARTGQAHMIHTSTHFLLAGHFQLRGFLEPVAICLQWAFLPHSHSGRDGEQLVPAHNSQVLQDFAVSAAQSSGSVQAEHVRSPTGEVCHYPTLDGWVSQRFSCSSSFACSDLLPSASMTGDQLVVPSDD